MKVWTVKYKGYNTDDYYETLSAKDKAEAYQRAQTIQVKRDDRDIIDWIKEDYTEGLYWKVGQVKKEEE